MSFVEATRSRAVDYLRLRDGKIGRRLFIKTKSFDLLSLGVYSVAHFTVDFSCAFLLFRLVRIGAIPYERVVFTFVLYNCLAFGLEFLIGLFFNAQTARIAATLGELLLATGLLLGMSVAGDLVCFRGAFIDLLPDLFSSLDARYSWRLTLACVFVGVGNAFFHVGGGIDSLVRNDGQYWRSGVFISTGALGLALGISFGDNIESGLSFAHVFAMTIISAGMIWFSCKNSFQRSQMDLKNARSALNLKKSVSISSIWGVCALLFVIFSRSVVGFVAPEIWNIKSLPTISGLSLAVAAFLGKFSGGFAADFSDGRTYGAWALIAAIPFLEFSSSPFLFWVGVFLLNSTTAITLSAVAKKCGNLIGFAFGLTTLALLAGFFVYDLLSRLLEHYDCLAAVNGLLLVMMVASAAALARSINKSK